jgi:hypothetical protein
VDVVWLSFDVWREAQNCCDLYTSEHPMSDVDLSPDV